MNRIIVLESGFLQDVPEQMMDYLSERNITEWEHYDMRQKFWPENRESTYEFFSKIDETDIMLANTTFVDFQWLELMSLMFCKLSSKKLTLKIQNPLLPKYFQKYLEKRESDITPDTKKYDDDPDLREEFKKDMNKLFLMALQIHNVYWIGSGRITNDTEFDDFLIKSEEDIVKHIKDWM